MQKPISRRQSLQSLGLATLAASLPVFMQGRGVAGSSEPLEEWIKRLYLNARRLENGRITGLQWQEAMDLIYAGAPIADLRQRLDFTSVKKQILDQIPADRGELFHRVQLTPTSEATAGAEPRLALITKVAHIKRGRSIPPHGHSNMASAFLCLSGEFAVRQYDKLEESEATMVLRQTVDQPSASVGTWSSISDYRNNVHWLTAKTDDCFLFTSKLIGIETGRKLVGRINVDVLRAQTLGRDTMLAKKITSHEAAELY